MNIISKIWHETPPLWVAFWGWLVLGGSVGWNVFWGAFFDSVYGKYGIFYNAMLYIASIFGLEAVSFFVFALCFLNAAYCVFASRKVYLAACAYKKNKICNYTALFFTASYILITAQRIWKVILSL